MQLQELLAASELAWQSGQFREGLAISERAVRDLPAGSAEQTRALLLLAKHHAVLGNAEQAIDAAGHGLRLALALPLVEAACELHGVIAMALSDLEHHDEALAQATAAFGRARQAGLAKAEAVALSRVAWSTGKLGDPEMGERLGLMSLSLAREAYAHGEIDRILNTLAGLALTSFEQLQAQGDTAWAQNALRRAIHYSRQAHKAALRDGHPASIAAATNNLGKFHALLGEHEAGMTLLLDAADQAQRLGLHTLIERNLNNQVECLTLQGRYEQALPVLSELFSRLEAHPLEGIERIAHQAAHRVHTKLQQSDLALQHLAAFQVLEAKRIERQQTAGWKLAADRQLMSWVFDDPDRRRWQLDMTQTSHRLRTTSIENMIAAPSQWGTLGT